MHSPAHSTRGNRGTVLIVTMWIVLVLVGLVLVMARSVRVEALASANRVAGVQAETIARGALQYVLSQVDDTQGSPSLDEAECEEVDVGAGYYWVLKPDLSDDRSYYFGITDEASRLNLNAASMDMLLKLPNMTAELAAAIIDWRDSDSEVSPGGAESEYYLLLNPPYMCKNGPFETVDELMLVRDVTPELLYGEDTNRNGVLDPNEDDADETDPPDNRDGQLDRGLFPYLTVYSREPNTTATGEERIDVNQPPGDDLTNLLRNSVSEDRLFQVLDLARRSRPFQNIFDFYVKTGLQPEEFVPIADSLTTGNQTNLVGMINVNTAPREVLLCLPDLDENDVDALIQRRDDPTTDHTSIGWIVEALEPEKAVAIGSYITARSYQFSADIVSVSGDGRAFRRYRAVIDARNSPARVVYWKDLTGLGWPLDPEILTALRSGEGLSATTILALGGSR
jgi:type II secretory pathway component PulK